MHIITLTFFAGPNRHVLRPAVEARLDLGNYGAVPSTAHTDFAPRLIEVLPGLKEHHCSRGHRGGFAERLQEGTYLGHVVEHVALECLYLGGERGVYGKTRELSGQLVTIVFESETEPGGRLALQLAIETVTGIWDNRAIDDYDERLQNFRNELGQYRLGPSTRALAAAARRRDIPVARLDRQNLIRLGQGVNQRRIMATLSDNTNIVGVEVAQDKQLASQLLQDAGLPVPLHFTARSFEEARLFADRIGYPVVVKPLDGSHGHGVVMNISSPQQLRQGLQAAQQLSTQQVLIQQQIAGVTLRLLVVGNHMVAATERKVPRVVGDGVHTLNELMQELNRDPRRGPDHGFPMSWAMWDQEAEQTIARQGYARDTVLPPKVVVDLRSTANMSTGAEAFDVTAKVCPQLANDAVRAARAVGLDVAGVDVVTPRLDCSLTEANGAIIEVNAAPGLRMHLYPAAGVPQPVADAIIDHLFWGRDGRIPVAAVTGTNGKTTVTRMLGHIASRSGYRVGMATTDGISIGGEVVKSGDLTGPWSARLVLNDPTVQWAVLETARGGIARGGLGFDDVDVAVVTNIGQDHLGQDGVETLEDLIHLKALLVDVVRPNGSAVLNADDARVLALKNRCRGRIVLFSTEPANPEVVRHLHAGGEAVYCKRGFLYHARAGVDRRLIGIRALPSSLGGVASINVANAAAAAAAALALGLAPSLVAEGLRTFPAGGAGLNRGRLEMLDGGDLRVLVDYGHNVPAITALGDICRRLRPRRIVTVVGLPGDRRDDDIVASGQVVASFSHRVIIREDADRRGREPGAVAELIRRAAARVPTCDVKVVLDEAESVKEAILTAEPGSLVLILYERYQCVREAAEEALVERGRQGFLQQA
ncbi:MAG: cyanophycin synthetase [Sulfobacillus acidophilus]|uniref:Cyanophycin synthetase n=1 Tax=Sulfobacillus acidophilus TaxID=53633 RepID=A0A2T2WH80_9FIRM|nr:MAG: cyanophycin synthetase [Sulfobacillus acidophilus]